MDLSIIIVAYNGRELVRDCLNSIFQNTAGIEFEVFVVDNASVDGTPNMVQREFPQVRLGVNQKNLGFAAANNLAIRGAQGDFILLLNQDMRVLSGTLAEMVGFMRNHPEAAVGGCHLVDEEGKMVRHARRFPGVWDQATIILKVPHFFPKILDKYLMADFDYAKMEPQEVDSLRGSFFMIRHEAIAKIGPLDERYFFWFEEVDFCRRARAAGYKILYNGAVKCIDLVGQSVKTLGQYKRQKMFLESMVKYFRKWYPGWRAWLIGVLRPIGLAMAWAADKYRSAARVS